MTAAAIGVTRRYDCDGRSGSGRGGGPFRTVFAEVLETIGNQKSPGSSRASSNPPAFELKPEFCDEYDPTFCHLRRPEHQFAMDVVARLRKQKWGNNKDAAETHCLPLVCQPPTAHPRLLPCRLLLHLPLLDAAIRRSLLFAVTGGSWLPPLEPVSPSNNATEEENGDVSAGSGSADMTGVTVQRNVSPTGAEVPVTTFGRQAHSRTMASSSSSFLKRLSSDAERFTPFSKDVVAASAIAFLEVLQLLTLQVHT